jgi:hypothetical protein
MNRKPIYSALQYPSYKEGGEGDPTPYLSNAMGSLGNIQSEMEWLFFDFCRMHQIVYKEIGRVEEGLDRFIQENKQDLTLSGDTESSENEFYKELQKVRILDSIIAQDHENRRVIGFVDQMAVVGLWTLGEQFLGKVYRQFIAIRDGISSDKVSSPYRWDDFIKNYAAIDIDLATCENFHDANECRAVNNAIKHDPRVGKRLEVFPYFLPYKGQQLMNVPLEMQRYLNGVSNFLGSLIEKANAKLE